MNGVLVELVSPSAANAVQSIAPDRPSFLAKILKLGNMSTLLNITYLRYLFQIGLGPQTIVQHLRPIFCGNLS